MATKTIQSLVKKYEQEMERLKRPTDIGSQDSINRILYNNYERIVEDLKEADLSLSYRILLNTEAVGVPKWRQSEVEDEFIMRGADMAQINMEYVMDTLNNNTGYPTWVEVTKFVEQVMEAQRWTA